MMIDLMDRTIRDDPHPRRVLGLARLRIIYSCKSNHTPTHEFLGTANYEHCKWDKDTDADHDIHMPFTRLLAGATDYHLGGFRSLPRDKFKNQERNPYVMSTRCHILACTWYSGELSRHDLRYAGGFRGTTGIRVPESRAYDLGPNSQT